MCSVNYEAHCIFISNDKCPSRTTYTVPYTLRNWYIGEKMLVAYLPAEEETKLLLNQRKLRNITKQFLNNRL